MHYSFGMVINVKEENFKRIAERRTNNILDSIEQLKNLSNSSFYEYTDEQIISIFDAIEEETKSSKEYLLQKNNKKKKRFTL